jgi:hypothetical protein
MSHRDGVGRRRRAERAHHAYVGTHVGAELAGVDGSRDGHLLDGALNSIAPIVRVTAEIEHERAHVPSGHFGRFLSHFLVQLGKIRYGLPE